MLWKLVNKVNKSGRKILNKNEKKIISLKKSTSLF